MQLNPSERLIVGVELRNTTINQALVFLLPVSYRLMLVLSIYFCIEFVLMLHIDFNTIINAVYLVRISIDLARVTQFNGNR